ncbi:hypothetical protein ABTX62_04115 [Streptomyces sp. NPDC096046]|uniref:hypothetical protein n=1 Tax=Streptomyces sp. NPDC096046 TaxID=3155542 RepID=UPI00332922F1
MPEERVPRLAGAAARGDAGVPDAWPPESGEQVVAALREAGPATEVWARAGTRSSGG